MHYTKKWFRINSGGTIDLRDSTKNRIRRILVERISRGFHQEWIQTNTGGTNKQEIGANGLFDPSQIAQNNPRDQMHFRRDHSPGL